jgi:trans-aconitate methyltransferase
MGDSDFDDYASNYEEVLDRALAATGERAAYFARGRVLWLRRRLEQMGFEPQTIMDFGCGTATATPYLLQMLGGERVVGIDASVASLAVARARFGSLSAEFLLPSQYRARGEIDLAYCNGVFHHVPASERGDCLDFVHSCLKPGGCFALWENNSWNPGTRHVMSKIAFDKDAVCLTAAEARRLVRRAGFTAICTDYCFLFPRSLRYLRPLEFLAAKLPLGAQYMVLCRKG